ncbi:MAG: PAS domain-containing protein [Planctomycetota bacterium]|jgi:PAS domain S-box-containing protein
MSVEKMRDNQKTKVELLQEVETLRRRVTELEGNKLEHKQAEKALRESEEKYRCLTESLDELVYRADPNTFAATYVNSAVERFYGYSVEQWLEEPNLWEDLIHPDDRERVLAEFNEVHKELKSAVIEYRIINKNKEVRWVEDHVSWEKDQRGKVVSMNGVLYDITERKRAEEEVKKFKEMTERATFGCAVADLNGNLTYINESFAKMHGFAQAELIGKNLQIFHSDAQMKRVNQLNKRLVEKGEGLQGEEVWHVHRDGTEFPTLMSNWILKDPNGNPYLMCGTAVNITERKRAEDALRESEKRFRHIFENIAVGVYRTMPDGQILMANPALAHMLGYSSFEELSQRNLEEEGFEPQYRRSTFREEIEREGRIVSLESTWITRDGKKLHVIENARAVRDEDGKTLYYEGTAENITERKRAEDALRESEKKYKTLFQGAAEGIIVADTETKEFKYANPAICTMLGYTEDELEQMGVRDIHPKEDLEYIISKFEAQARGERILTSNIPCLRKDGTIMYVDISTAMVLIDGRQCNVGFFTDITEHKQALEELNEYREKMAHAERLASLGTLSATLAHELSQPLTAIRLSIENSLAELETTSSPDTVIEDLKDGLSAVSDVALKVDVLRDFAQKSSKEIISEVNLKVVAERILNLLNESALRAKVTLQLEGMEELPHIRSNEKDLEQLFFALVENAIEAADGKKSRRLVICGGVKDKHIELRFTDDCCGIAPENLDKIFEPFFTTSPPSEGTGLGLCIVERIVSGAGGKIRVESKAGKGSTFFITLPINRGGRS